LEKRPLNERLFYSEVMYEGVSWWHSMALHCQLRGCQVDALSFHHHSVTLGKLFTHVCSPSSINWYQPSMVTPWSW